MLSFVFDTEHYIRVDKKASGGKHLTITHYIHGLYESQNKDYALIYYARTSVDWIVENIILCVSSVIFGKCFLDKLSFQHLSNKKRFLSFSSEQEVFKLKLCLVFQKVAPHDLHNIGLVFTELTVS